MFSDPTRAIVLSSSHTKGVGPRIGSIGYASSIGIELHPSRFIQLNSQFVTGLVLTAIRMSFIRYGYEKRRPKYEVKLILGVTPIINELKKTEEVDSIISTFIDKFPKTDFTTHSWLSTKMDLINKTDNIEVCILAPTKNTDLDLRTCSEMEFCAWFNSFMILEYNKVSIWRSIHKENVIERLRSKEMRDCARLLSMYYRSKNEADDLVNYVSAFPERRDSMIKLIRALKATYSRKLLQNHDHHICNLLLEGRYTFKKGTEAMNTLYCKLTEFMFIDKAFDSKLDVLKKSKALKNKELIADKLKRTKEVLESMADEISEK